jgi:hypothetical protein
LDISEIDDMLAKASLNKTTTPWEDGVLSALRAKRKTFKERLTLTPWQQALLERLSNV